MMKIRPMRLYGFSLFVSLIVLYLIATDHHGWYIYVLLGLVMAERALIALVAVLLNIASRELMKKMQEQGFGGKL